MENKYSQPVHPTTYRTDVYTDGSHIHEITPGMTLLDRMAIQYIPHDIQKPRNLYQWFRWAMGCTYKSATADYKDIAKHAYAQAAALMEEREKYVK